MKLAFLAVVASAAAALSKPVMNQYFKIKSIGSNRCAWTFPGLYRPVGFGALSPDGDVKNCANSSSTFILSQDGSMTLNQRPLTLSQGTLITTRVSQSKFSLVNGTRIAVKNTNQCLIVSGGVLKTASCSGKGLEGLFAYAEMTSMPTDGQLGIKSADSDLSEKSNANVMASASSMITTALGAALAVILL